MFHSRLRSGLHRRYERIPVQVSNISLAATERDIQEFFSLSGDIQYVEMLRESERAQVAYVTFKDSQGADTAMLLTDHVEDIKNTHLRDLMADSERCKSMMVEFDGLLVDFSRQRATIDTMDKLFKLAEAARLKEKIQSMFCGEHDRR